MSGTGTGWRNPLMGEGGWSFGTAESIPTTQPPQTYTGVIPSTPDDYASRAAELPHEYYQAQQLLDLNNPRDQQLNRLLQLFYLQRQRRT